MPNRRHRRFFTLLLSFALLCAAGDAFAFSKETMQIQGVTVTAWLPGDAPSRGETWPVILFSHGFHGCSTQSSFLTEALADAGYAVFAPNHNDAACRRLHALFTRSDEPFRDAEKWTDITYSNRVDDLHRLILALMEDSRFKSAIDWKHLGVMGHSLGGYTVLSMAGAWPKLRDARIKAVLALSPYTLPFIKQKTLGALHVPVMYQGGTMDYGITPFLRDKDGAYDQTSAPKYYVEFDRAGHLAWTDLHKTQHQPIVDYALAFFNHALKGKPFPEALMHTQTDVTDFRSE